MKVTYFGILACLCLWLFVDVSGLISFAVSGQESEGQRERGGQRRRSVQTVISCFSVPLPSGGSL